MVEEILLGCKNLDDQVKLGRPKTMDHALSQRGKSDE